MRDDIATVVVASASEDGLTFTYLREPTEEGASWIETTPKLSGPVDQTFTLGRVSVSGGAALPDAGGVVAAIFHWDNPPFNNIDDATEICERFAMNQIRRCGQGDTEQDISLAAGPVPDPIFVKITDEEVTLVDLPTDEAAPADGSGWRPSFYETATGVGVVGYGMFETVDGVTWQVRSDIPVSGSEFFSFAVRGEQAVYRSFVLVQRFSADQPVQGMGYSDDGGRTWTGIPMASVFDDEPVLNRYFNQVQAGDGGWAMTASRTENTLFSQNDRVTGPFTLESEDGRFLLTGVMPYGRATLQTADGAVLQNWEHFEPRKPSWNGFDIADGMVYLEIEDDTVEFSFETWMAIDGAGSEEEMLPHDIVLSTDGQRWDVVRSSMIEPQIIAIGSDEVVVGWSPRLFEDDPYLFQIEVIPFPRS